MPRRPLTLALTLALALASTRSTPAQTAPHSAGAPLEVPNGNTFRGVEARIDLPPAMHVKNSAGRDGLGLCVFASLDMLAQWGNVEPLIGIKTKMEAEKGGGWPEKVEAMVKRFAPGQEVDLIQYQGTDASFLDAAMATGRPVGITYGYGAFYQGQTIAHMVVLAHLDREWAAIIDNNDPEHWTWMGRAELLKRWTHPEGYGWAIVLLDPPPPPPPHN